jgi:hypothetical protein
MKTTPCLVWLIVFGGIVSMASAQEKIVISPQAGTLETLASREVMRYLYLRTDKLLPIVDGDKQPFDHAIVVARKDRNLLKEVIHDGETLKSIAALKPQQFLLKTIDNPQCLVIIGGDDVGTLYGAYRFAETLGVRFYLHGDVIPETKSQFSIPKLDETGSPVFDLRGILPFHDFSYGPDWWTIDDYKAILTQLAKLRMNFIGLHTYPEWNPAAGPEASVWIGPKEFVNKQGQVQFSYPAGYSTTQRGWLLRPLKTSSYSSGAAQLFADDDYGSPVLQGCMEWPRDPKACNEVFNRSGEMFHTAFSYAHRLGIKTCLGTESPLGIPERIIEQMKARKMRLPTPKVITGGPYHGRSVYDKETLQAMYEGVFERIKRCHPLDYYWLWTPETWLHQPPLEEVEVVSNDIQAAVAAAKAVKAPFQLATCGWVLGPPNNPAQFDRDFPKEMPFSCINRNLGRDPVEAAFEKISGRAKWAIPWLEDDEPLMGNIGGVQLWAGRMYRDAISARRYQCTGLMGIHWRTNVVAPNIAALAKAGWDWTDTLGEQKQPSLLEFYRDWALANFGQRAAQPIAEMFNRVDGQFSYGFVDEFAALRPKIVGPGNLDRFDYWLNVLRCQVELFSKVRPAIDRYRQALDEAAKQTTPELKKQVATEKALPARIEFLRGWNRMMTYAIASVVTPADLATVANLHQHYPEDLATLDSALEAALGKPLPPEDGPNKTYQGPARIIVPTLRTTIESGERLNLKVMIMTPGAGRKGETLPTGSLFWRPLGKGDFNRIPLTHVARRAYQAELPVMPAGTAAIEYYLQAKCGQTTINFPTTAPAQNQTVVVLE